MRLAMLERRIVFIESVLARASESGVYWPGLKTQAKLAAEEYLSALLLATV